MPNSLTSRSDASALALEETFLHFLQTLTFKDTRRLVLKSPPHSCRIGVLLEMFPKARFIHIVRDPYLVFLLDRAHVEIALPSARHAKDQAHQPG